MKSYLEPSLVPNFNKMPMSHIAHLRNISKQRKSKREKNLIIHSSGFLKSYNHLPLRKVRDLSFEQTRNTQCPVWYGLSGSGQKEKMWTVYDEYNDDERWRTNFDEEGFGSGELTTTLRARARRIPITDQETTTYHSRTRSVIRPFG